MNRIKKYFSKVHSSYTLIKYDHNGAEGIESIECGDLGAVLENIMRNVNVSRLVPIWFEIVPYETTETKIAFLAYQKKLRRGTIDIAVMEKNPRMLSSEDLLKNIANKNYKEFFIVDNSDLDKPPSMYSKGYYSEQVAVDLANWCDCDCYSYIQLSDGRNNNGDKTGGFVLGRKLHEYYAIDARLNDIENFKSISGLFDASLLQECRGRLK